MVLEAAIGLIRQDNYGAVVRALSRVNTLAEKLIGCAIKDKQAWAFQQIADRLEGKPVQVVDATVEDHRTLHEFSDAELTAILRRHVGVVAVESEEERRDGEPFN